MHCSEKNNLFIILGSQQYQRIRMKNYRRYNFQKFPEILNFRKTHNPKNDDDDDDDDDDWRHNDYTTTSFTIKLK